MNLTTSQRGLLTALVNGYEETGSRVKSQQLADEIGRDPGTVRNRMQLLTSLDLAEGIPGRDGGYRPTRRAFETLGRRRLEDAETVRVAHGYERLDAAIDEIDFTTVHDPEHCRARVAFRESVSRFDVGDPVIVGPTPRSGLTVAGVVESHDEARSELLVEVTDLEAPLEPRATTDGGSDAQ